MKKYDIALIGLGVMGQNLARNFASRKLDVLVYNRHSQKAKDFIREYGSEHLDYRKDLKELVKNLKRPRKLLLMVKAGDPVDMVSKELLKYLEKGDMIIDGGNSYYKDTIRRTEELGKKGICFVGMGVSGGEEGALHGPSLMPGGSNEDWKELSPILKKIAAKDFSGNSCVTHIGTDGAGHYVKMVHNGIEYAVMQMMAEAYDMLRNLYQLQPNQIANVFEIFHQSNLKSFLFEIAIPVLKKKDDLKEGYLIDAILDKAGQKGTGAWSAMDALERGEALPIITAAVHARSLSSRKKDRVELSKHFSFKKQTLGTPLEEFVPLLEKSLYAGIICAYTEGLNLIAIAAQEQDWKINFAEVIRIWQGGCIIRADLLKILHQAFEEETKKNHLFSLTPIQKLLKENLFAFRYITTVGLAAGLPLPAFSNGLNYFASLTQANLPANLIQGLRDYFGAHTYERVDRQGVFHAEWSND